MRRAVLRAGMLLCQFSYQLHGPPALPTLELSPVQPTLPLSGSKIDGRLWENGVTDSGNGNGHLWEKRGSEGGGGSEGRGVQSNGGKNPEEARGRSEQQGTANTAMDLRTCYAMPGTDVWYAATGVSYGAALCSTHGTARTTGRVIRCLVQRKGMMLRRAVLRAGMLLAGRSHEHRSKSEDGEGEKEHGEEKEGRAHRPRSHDSTHRRASAHHHVRSYPSPTPCPAKRGTDVEYAARQSAVLTSGMVLAARARQRSLQRHCYAHSRKPRAGSYHPTPMSGTHVAYGAMPSFVAYGDTSFLGHMSRHVHASYNLGYGAPLASALLPAVTSERAVLSPLPSYAPPTPSPVLTYGMPLPAEFGPLATGRANRRDSAVCGTRISAMLLRDARVCCCETRGTDVRYGATRRVYDATRLVYDATRLMVLRSGMGVPGAHPAAASARVAAAAADPATRRAGITLRPLRY
eukprot:2233683-Rhodomonas_salina.1